MNMHTTSNTAIRAAALALLALLASAPFARAQIEGKILTTDNQQVAGKIRWYPAKRVYEITQTRQGGQSYTSELPPDKVKRIVTAEPAKLRPAIAAVRSGNASAAIPVLQEIVKTYAMLEWDEKAARYLAEAQLASGDAAGAAATCEGLIKAKPSVAYLGEVAPIYWQALLKTGKTAKLGDYITKAIAAGDPAASAAALIMRGDMLMEKKETLGALKDGYLRVVILYENVKEIQPEALYKAAKAFDALNQNANAERMRTKLRTKYAQSEYARKL